MRPIAGVLCVTAALLAGSAAAQPRTRGAQPDVSLVASDAITRVREFVDSGNIPEALRVFQQTMDSEGDRLIESSGDRDVYIPVRRRLHETLLASPELLKRYREEQEPRARAMLDEGRTADVEQTRLLTPSGMEAALRLAQTEMEAARFESARLILAELENHPDRAPGATPSKDAATLVASLARYLPRPEIVAWAARWAKEAGVPVPTAQPVTPPPTLLHPRSPTDPAATANWATPGPAALQSVDLAPTRDRDDAPGTRAGQAWVFPELSDETVYVNDGESISAYDAATLARLWKTEPAGSGVSLSTRQTPAIGFFGSASGLIEDIANVAVGSGTVVGAGGVPELQSRRGDERIHAVDAATGALRWSIKLEQVDERLRYSAVRGPVCVDADTVVLSVRKTGLSRLGAGLYLVGLDLYSGRTRWVRSLASIGTNPWGRLQGRPDGMIIEHGVIYRADEMGVVAAYEARSGRPVWLRVIQPSRVFGLEFRGMQPTSAYEIHLPLAADGSIYCLEPQHEGARLLRLREDDGAILTSRPQTDFVGSQDTAHYIERVGNWLAVVGSTRVGFVDLAKLTDGTVRLSPVHTSPQIAGRAFVSGDRLVIPLERELATIDPASPGDEKTIPIPVSGNVLAVPGSSPGDAGHLLVADSAQLHTFVQWERAQAILARRASQRPDDPAPLLTLAELSYRAGHGAGVVDVSDRLLALLDRRRADTDSLRARSDLFTLLLGIVRRGREALEAVSPAPEGEAPTNEAPAVRDLAVLDALGERLARAAESPEQQVGQLFERSWLRDAQSRHAQAVELLQQVLTSDVLAGVRAGADTRAGLSSGEAPLAGEEATRKLTELIRRVGPGAYGAFDQQSRQELDALGEQATPAQIEALARRYPVAAVVPGALLRAAEGYVAAHDDGAARRCAALGARNARFAIEIGRDEPRETLGGLLGVLLKASSREIDAEPAYRLLCRVNADQPDLSIPGESTVAHALESLRARMNNRSGAPRLGTRAGAVAQTIEGWTPVEALESERPYLSADAVVMVSDILQQIALWAPGVEDGTLRPLWTRPAPAAPTVVRISPDSTILFWPTQGAGYIEAVSNIDGRTRWKSPEFNSLFAPAREAPGEMQTPLEGRARNDDLLIASDASRLALVQRNGRAVVFDLASGEAAWHNDLGVARVFEIECAGNALVVSGTTLAAQSGQERLSPALGAFDLRTGKPLGHLSPEAIGDHARWIKALPGGEVVVATSEGILRFDPVSGAVRWNRAGAPYKQSLAGWVVGDSVFVLDNESSLNIWRLSLTDGSGPAEPLDHRARLDLPLTASSTGGVLSISTERGFVSFDPAGRLVGVDGLAVPGGIEPPIVGDRVYVAVEASKREFTVARPDPVWARVYFMEKPGGRLIDSQRVRLFESPRRVSAVDGKVLIEQGPLTIVLDVPPDQPAR